MNTRLAANYGGWMYCDKCNENTGYLCYATYDRLEFKYKYNSVSIGIALLYFEDSEIAQNRNDELVIIKNRFCCLNDNSPLITILDKKVTDYEMRITCKSCKRVYKKVK